MKNIQLRAASKAYILAQNRTKVDFSPF